MRSRFLPTVGLSVFLLLVETSTCVADDGGDRLFDLTRGSKPTATLVVPDEKAPIWENAIALISSTVKRWGGSAPSVLRLTKNDPLPDGNLIVIGTPESNAALATEARRTESKLSLVAFGDPHGFAIEARTTDRGKHLYIAGRTPRGAYNGAVYCRDFLLDATADEPGKAEVFVRSASVLRSPALAARGTYHLSIYGVAMKYTAEDWMNVIDRYAEDAMERVYFWLSGHHPSKKYPHVYDVDSTKGTKLTVDGVKRLIRYCHDRGIKFYIGGGVFAWTASHYLGQGHPEVMAVKAGGLCPSKPFARTATREHFLEMYDTWPEADGFMFEIRDEQGECQCDDCRRAIDKFGSRAYGRSEITWLQEFAREAWAKNPKLQFCWLIGYAEHKDDVAYYEQVRKMSDPRFEWLDARVGLDLKGAWRLPGAGGEPRPLASFGRQIAHWDPFYKLPVDSIRVAARRSADEGLCGYVPAFEPGFGSASYYSDQIPLPTDILPYCLTGFAYREVTWEPGLTSDELKNRIHRRYFSPDAPARFADEMIYLRQFSIDHADEIVRFAKPRFGYTGERIEPLSVDGERTRVRAIPDVAKRKAEAGRLRKTFDRLAAVADDLKRMNEIEAAMKQATGKTSPKTRDGFAIIQRAIDDTRDLYKKAVSEPKALAGPIE